jgi:uncharacterized protein (DUF302 family)
MTVKKRILILLTTLFTAGTTLAQYPVPAFTQEQMEQAMVRQMQMMAAMFEVRTSRLGFDETVDAIKAAAEKRGWKVGQVYDVQAAMHNAGIKEAGRMKVISTCPVDANERLAKASQGKAPPLPCRYTVFDGKDGKVKVVKFNTELFAKNMPGETGKVLADIAEQEEALLKGIVE